MTTIEDPTIEETIVEGETEGDYKLVVEFIDWTPQRLPEDVEMAAAKLLMALGDKFMTCDEEELESIILFDTMVSEDRDEILSITGVAPGTFYVAYHDLAAEEEPLIILAKATLDIKVLGECECECDCETVTDGE